MPLATITVGPVFLVVGAASLVFAIVSIVDMARRPSFQWQQAGSSKALWIVLEVVFVFLLGFISIIIGVLYWAMVRPRLLAVERQGGGPGYGGPGAWPPQPPTYTDMSTAPWSPYPPPREPGPEGEVTEPPAYPGGGPPPYPGQAPVPPYPGSTPGPATGPVPGQTPAPTPYPQGPGYSAPPTSNPPFGWYPDPSGRHEQRYWDGTRWTEHVSNGDQRSTDPLPG